MEIWWGFFVTWWGFLWREQGFMIFCKKGTKVSTSRKYATKGEIDGGEFNSPEIDEETKSPTQRREGDVL